MIIDIGAGTKSVNFHKGGGKAVKVEDNKAVKYTENGTFEITPSDGYDGIKGAEVKVEVTKPVEKFVMPDGMKLGYSSYFDVSNLDTSKVTVMSYMFANYRSLKPLDLSNLDTSKVTVMSYMFNDCSSLTSLDVSNFDTSKVTDMSDMFNDCRLLASLDVSNFDTSKVTVMSYMFNDCSSLASLDVSNFDTSNVTDMAYMFNNCSSLASLDVSNFDTSKVEGNYNMFSLCYKLKKLVLSSKFFNSTSLTTYDFSGAKPWTEETSLATLVDALPQLTTTKTIKLSANTKNALTDEQKTTITDKGWTIA